MIRAQNILYRVCHIFPLQQSSRSAWHIPPTILGVRAWSLGFKGGCEWTDSTCLPLIALHQHSANIWDYLALAGAMSSSDITPRLLSGKEDSYEGLIIDSESLPSTPDSFASVLQSSLDAWKEHGYRGLWLKIPSTKAHFVGHAVDAGFEFHHAEKASHITKPNRCSCSTL
jgi:hypothetical protein